MPRYYCDYCDTYLTHDSPSVRKQHNAGYKHKANVRAYYQQFEEQQTQSLIDQKVKEHLGQKVAVFHQQVGVAIHQHYSLGYKPPIPMLPPPSLPVPSGPPGSSQPPLLPTMRPPVLPPPTGNPGYGPPPTFRPPVAPIPAGSGAAQANGTIRPPSLALPGAPGVRSLAPSPPSVNGVMPGPLAGPPGAYQQQSQQQQQPQTSQRPAPPTGAGYGGYGYEYGPPGSASGYVQGAPTGPPGGTQTGPSGNYNAPQQQRGLPSAVPGQSSFNYGQPLTGMPRPAQTASNSYGPSPPGAPVAYRT